VPERSRPLLMHEKWQKQARDEIEQASTMDLAGLSWRDLADIFHGLRYSEQLQAALGVAAPPEVWRAAQNRIAREMDSRPRKRPRRAAAAR